jgi:hypothetical protein
MRSKFLPEGGNIDEARSAELAQRVRDAVRDGSLIGKWTKDADARDLWAEVYVELSKATPGLIGTLLTRAPAYVLRIALIYAILDKANSIGVEHIEAGLSVWKYAEDSARYIFGDSIGDLLAERILEELREKIDGLTRTEIRDLGGRHCPSKKVNESLKLLLELGLVTRETVATTGRPAERWKLVTPLGTKATEATKGLITASEAPSETTSSSKESRELYGIATDLLSSFTCPATKATKATKGRPKTTGGASLAEVDANRPSTTGQAQEEASIVEEPF